MAKAIKHTVLVVLGLLVSFTACQTDEWTAFQEKEAPEGYVNIHFETEIPAMPVVTTRSVDPDGKGVNSMQLFCFNSYGLFITTRRQQSLPTGKSLENLQQPYLPIHAVFILLPIRI